MREEEQVSNDRHAKNGGQPRVSVSQPESCFQVSNHARLRALNPHVAGITVDKVNTTHDEDLANHVQYRIDRLTKQKDKDYWKFIEDYIQWVKVEAVNNKNAFTMLAAVIESEAKLDKNKDSVIANAATKLLDTMEAIESINKFFYDKVNTK